MPAGARFPGDWVLVFQDWALTERVTRLPDLSRMALRWLEHHRFAVAVAAALAAVFVYRMVVLQSQLALGIDAGSYLGTMHQLLGTDVTGAGLARPPLVGVALWPLVQLFGPLEATKILAVAASVLIGVPFYLLCSRFTGKAVALAVSLPFVFSLRYMDALNWGFLTLVGVGLFTLCFYLIHEVLTAPSFDKGRVLALGLATWALVATNRNSAFIYVATVLAFGVVLFVAGGRLRKGMPRLLPAALLAVFLSLPIVPIYLRTWFAVGDEGFLAIAQSSHGLSGGWDKLRYFFDPPLFWIVVALVGLAGAVVLSRRTPVGGMLLLTVFFAPFALCMLVVGEVGTRSAYFLYLPVWLGFGVSADALLHAARGRHAAVAANPVYGLAVLAPLAVLTIWNGHSKLPDAAEWYAYLEAEHVGAIEAVQRSAPAGAGVVYPGGLGRWVQGLAARRAYAAERRNVGSALLAGDRVTTNGSAFIADAYAFGDLPMDPALGIDNGQLRHLLYLDDRLIEIEYGAGPALRRVTLADAELQESVTTTESGVLVDRRTYELDGLRVVKEVTLPAHDERVTVALSVESGSGPVNSIVVPIKAALESMARSDGSQGARIGFWGSTHFGGDWWAAVFVDLVSDEGEAATLAVLPGEAIAVAEVKPESPRAEVTLAFTFQGKPSGTAAGLRSFAAEDVIRERGITFTLVDRYPAKPWFGDPLDATTLAWLEGAPYFRPLWERGTVAAYLVAPAAPDGESPTVGLGTDGGVCRWVASDSDWCLATKARKLGGASLATQLTER